MVPRLARLFRRLNLRRAAIQICTGIFLTPALPGTAFTQCFDYHGEEPIGSLDTPGDVRGVVVSGSYAYVADGDEGVQVIDVTTPTSPTLARTVDTPGNAHDLAVSGSYAYVADGLNGHGRDARGNLAPPGVYLYELVVPGYRSARRLVKLR